MNNTVIDIIPQVANSSLLFNGFPPSFEGNPWIFMSALFCTLVATMVSLVQIYFISAEIKNIPDKWNCPINIYRYQLILSYLAILIACGPDSVYLWTYGEVSQYTTSIILSIDRICDSLFLIPFLIFTWLQLKCGPEVKFQLIRRAVPLNVHLPNTDALKLNMVIGVLIMLMSFGVALSK